MCLPSGADLRSRLRAPEKNAANAEEPICSVQTPLVSRNGCGPDDMHKPREPEPGTISLRQVQEFCACFASSAISHDLSFRHAGSWRAIRAIVDAAENSGLGVAAVEFHAKHTNSLNIRLEGSSVSGVAALWRSIQAVPGIVLADWQLQAQPLAEG